MVQPENHHLAQFNIGRLLAPPDDPRVAAFMNALDAINGLADRSPGFVWRLTGAGNNATDLALANDPQLVPNLSVWDSVQNLEHFVWNTVHRRFYERRAEWFEILSKMHFAMWWLPEGKLPTLDEALLRLEHLRANGDSDHAFGWAYLKDARLWRVQNCAATAAE